MRPSAQRRLLLAATIALGACQSGPLVRDDTAARSAGPQTAFERERLTQARALTEAGRFGEALVEWEILSLFNAREPEYREGLARARAAARQRANQHLSQAAKALAAGDERLAGEHFLITLSLDPGNADAARGLRELERELNRRHFLGRPSRLTIGRANGYATSARAAPRKKSATRAETPEKTPETQREAPTSIDHSVLEHAALLIRDGEFTEALSMLARYLKANPADPAAKNALGRAWESFGDDALSKGRPRAALRALKRAAGHLEPSDPRLGEKIDALEKSLGPG